MCVATIVTLTTTIQRLAGGLTWCGMMPATVALPMIKVNYSAGIHCPPAKPAARLQDFKAAFGEDLRVLVAEFLKHMGKVK